MAANREGNRNMNITIRNVRVAGIFAVTAVLLIIPFGAMQFTQEVNWGPVDFAVAAVLLLGAGFACELVLRLVKGWGYRLAALGLVLLILLAVWAELAVGVFGTSFAGS